MINIKNRVPAEVFLWHPQQRQLRGNTPTKQRKLRNFKWLNIIVSTKFELLINNIIVRSYCKCSNCCPFTRTHARRRFLHSSITSSTTVCCRPHQTSIRRCFSWSKSFTGFWYTWCCYLLYTTPNAVVDRIEVETVGRPAVRRDERWCLTTQKLNRRTCPTNGEDISGLVSE